MKWLDMNTTSAFVAGIIGLIAGCFIPLFGNKIISYKAKQKKKIYVTSEISLLAAESYIIASGALFGMAGYFMRPVEGMFIYLFIITALIITYVDNQIRIIANEIVLWILVLGIGYRFLLDGFPGILEGLGGLAVGALVCLLPGLIIKKGIGAGDAKFIMAAGFVVGYPGVLVLLAVMGAAILACCGVGLFTGKIGLQSYFPMGGFITAGFMAAFYTGMLMKIII